MKKTKQQERVAFAHRFSELARQSGLSQRELAERIGISAGHVSKLMTGEAYPTPETMTKICTAYGITEDAFRIPEDQVNIADLQVPKLKEKPAPYRLKGWKLIRPEEVLGHVIEGRKVELVLKRPAAISFETFSADKVSIEALLELVKCETLIALERTEEDENETD